MFFYEDHTAIGIGLICVGIACYTLSVMMFFDRGFLIIANVSYYRKLCKICNRILIFFIITIDINHNGNLCISWC